MGSKAILDKLLKERVIDFLMDQDTMPNTPRRLGQFAVEILRLSQNDIAVLIEHYVFSFCRNLVATSEAADTIASDKGVDHAHRFHAHAGPAEATDGCTRLRPRRVG